MFTTGFTTSSRSQGGMRKSALMSLPVTGSRLLFDNLLKYEGFGIESRV
jgi:hypothetical protein